MAYFTKPITYSIADINVKEIKPIPIPFVMEYDNSITTMVKNADVALIALLASIYLKFPFIIKTPT